MTVDGTVTGALDGPGLVVLLGVTHADTAEIGAALAAKIWQLRIMARREVGGRPRCRRARREPVHVVRRHAQGPAPVLVGRRARCRVGAALRVVLRRSDAIWGQTSRPVCSVAHMAVASVNDGPITILLDTDA